MNTALTASNRLISEADYLAGELLANERHEYMNGRIYAMAGASKRHNRIAGNIYRAVMATGSACTAYISDMKVHSDKYHSYYYPDVVVGCDPNETDEYVLEKPCLIVEVTSDSTLRKDYLEKSLAYQAIPSVQVYLIVAQDKVQVDMLTRASDGAWELQQFNDLGAELSLLCPTMILNTKEIYDGMNF
ncbi:Uma2 family endonuclease [uncultured Thiothrix sp.]|uniref:Uma2 family endonuclease n=1 Tax=uncultured Thiothrix sp. TaxID=223185 RepID=UPI0026170794|nr:Uma2 family endonuclease [uncultured Thiothrix sp.]